MLRGRSRHRSFRTGWVKSGLSAPCPYTSAIGGEADIIWAKADIPARMSAFAGKADIRGTTLKSLLIAAKRKFASQPIPSETNGILVFRDAGGGGQTAHRLRIYPGDSVSYAADIGGEKPGQMASVLSMVNPPLIQIQDSNGACCTNWQHRLAAVRNLGRA